MKNLDTHLTKHVETVGWKFQNAGESSQRGPAYMKKHAMFLDLKGQHVKKSVLFKFINGFSAILNKIPAKFFYFIFYFVEIKKLILKCIWADTGLKMA